MTIKSEINELVSKYAEGVSFDVLGTPSRRLGDYSVNLAFKLEKEKGGKVMEWAGRIKSELESDKDLIYMAEKIEISKPGFINIFLKTEFLRNKFLEIIKKENNYGQSNTGGNKKINLEFVSANPTGPMTVHNVRAAAYGDTLGNIFKKCGYDVTKEYYINDIGVQVQKLGRSVLLRLKELKGEKIDFEDGLYKGDYIIDLAKKLLNKELPTDEIKQINYCRDFAVEYLIKSGQNSMANIGVNFDVWFREGQLHDSGEVPEVLDYLKEKDLVYEKDGASWFRVSNYFPDQQDAVVVKSDGSTSYLMNDIAYTKNKIEIRGFDKAINIWGTDHHGDKPRLLAGAKALGYGEKLEILLHQLIMVKEKDEYQRMSKREGKFVLLDDFAEKVSRDAIRFFFIAKDMNTHMEFNVDLAKEQSKKNPIFYAQYAFARLNSIFDKAGDGGIRIDQLKLENDEEEMMLVAGLVRFPELIEEIGESYRVHHLAEYVLGIANDFHKYYESHHILQDDKDIQGSRLALAKGVQIILKNCFDLMGISAPKKM